MQSFNEKIKQNAKYIILQQLIIPLINLLLTIYIIKKISVNDYGVYNLLYAMMGYLTLFSSMGLLNVAQRFVPEYFASKQYSKIKILFKSGLIIRLVLAIIILCILLLLGNWVNHLFKTENFDDYILFFSCGILFFLEVQLIEITLNSLLLNKSIMISYLIATVFRGGIAYLLLEQNMGLKGLLLAETIYFGLLFLSLLFCYHHNFSIKYNSTEQKLPIRRLLRYSGFSYLDEVGWTVLDVKTDFFIITSFLGPTMVGLYAFANQFIESISKVMPFKILRPLVRTVFFSKFAENCGKHQLNRHYNFLNKIIAFISFPIFMLVMAYGDKIIVYLFDTKYLPAFNVLLIFAGFMMMISFTFPLQLVVQAVERVEITFYSKVFSIYNLIGALLVVQIFGIIGVALVTCSARLFQFIFIFYRIRKIVPLVVEVNSLLKIFFNALLMMGTLFILKNFINNTLTLFCFSIFGIAFYLTISYVNKSFFNDEREIINKLLPRPIFLF